MLFSLGFGCSATALVLVVVACCVHISWLVVSNLLSVFDLDYYVLVRNYCSVVFVGFNVFHRLIWIIASWIEIIIVVSHVFSPFDLDY